MESLMNKLLDSVEYPRLLLDFELLSSSTDRVQYIYKQLMTLGILPHERVQLPPVKNAAISADHRTTGNQLYATRDYIEAIKCYNKAIANAPADSTELAVAYANRSSVLVALGKHDQALLDISRSLDIGCEQRIRDKLILRRETCQNYKSMNNLPTSCDIPSIIFEGPIIKHPHIPCASAKINISYDNKCGRKIIAAADITPGEVLAVEKVYTSCLRRKYFLLRCYYCHEEVFSLIPCKNCNLVMFCNEDCQSASWVEYHKYDCRIMPYYLNDDDSYSDLNILRIVLKAKHEHKSWGALSEAVSIANGEKDQTKKGFVNVKNKKIYDFKYYSSIHALETNESKLEPKEIFNHTLRSTLLLNLLATRTDIFNFQNWPDIQKDVFFWFIGDLLLHHSMTVSTNSQEIYTVYNENKSDNKIIKIERDCIANGIYSFTSLFNHSCNENMKKVFIGSSIILLSIRSIKKGEEIFDNYGVDRGTEDLLSRRSKISNWKFICECEACENNWPLSSDCMSVASKMKYVEFDNVIGDCYNFSKLHGYSAEKNIRYTMEKIYENLLNLEKYEPCQEFIIYKAFLYDWWCMYANRIQ